MNIQNADIIGACQALIAKYPGEKRLAVWAEFYPQGEFDGSSPGWRFVAVVGGETTDNEYGNGPTPEDAVKDVILRAGERDPKLKLLQQIEAKRSELAKLEAKLNPVPTVVETCPDHDEAPTGEQPAFHAGMPGTESRPLSA